MKEWTLFLRKGVPFHFGYGEFTARDVVHSHALMLREEAIATFVGMWRNVEEVKVINDYQVVFRMKGPATTLPYALSRSGDLRMVSKAQWDKEGLEGFEKRPAGTGSYQYVSRQLGQSIVFERVENHWSGIRPAFKELEMRLAPEESTRLAMLLNGRRTSSIWRASSRVTPRNAACRSSPRASRPSGCRSISAASTISLGTRNSKRRCPGTIGGCGRP